MSNRWDRHVNFCCLLLVENPKHHIECIHLVLFYNHIMEYDTYSHNLPNHDFILRKCWIFNNGKSSLQDSESTLPIFSDSFLWNWNRFDKSCPFRINTIGEIVGQIILSSVDREIHLPSFTIYYVIKNMWAIKNIDII